jgi:hypothetical protein
MGVVVAAHAKYGRVPKLQYLGKVMFEMYSRNGLPPDMALSVMKERITLNLEQIIVIVTEYQHLFIQHRRQSGINPKRLDALRRRNRSDIERLVATGELGVY